jgi:hypothetical protein
MTPDAYQELMQQLAADPTAARTKVREMVAEMAGSDPRMGAVLQAITARESAVVVVEDNEPPAVATIPPPAPPVAMADLARIRRLVNRLEGELDDLRRRNDLLASALGACYLCWGGDAGCPVCEGNGRPGSEPPDRPLFREYVTPAVRRVHPGGSVPPPPSPVKGA